MWRQAAPRCPSRVHLNTQYQHLPLSTSLLDSLFKTACRKTRYRNKSSTAEVRASYDRAQYQQLTVNSMQSATRSRYDTATRHAHQLANALRQYCEFGGTTKKCEEWLEDKHLDIHSKLYSAGWYHHTRREWALYSLSAHEDSTC